MNDDASSDVTLHKLCTEAWDGALAADWDAAVLAATAARQDARGLTALHYACARGHAAVAARLAAAAPSAVTAREHTRQWTPLHYAAAGASMGAAAVLLRHGAVLDAPDVRGRTPHYILHIALNWEEYGDLLRGEEEDSDTVHGDVAPQKPREVYSWGNGAAYELGHGVPEEREHMRRVRTLAGTDCVALALAGTHAAAVTADGRAWSWGTSDAGALGQGRAVVQVLPAPIPGLAGEADGSGAVAACVASEDRTAFLTRAGELLLCGAGCTRLPRPVGGFIAATAGTERVHVVGVALGREHFVACTAGGALFAWGRGAEGQLGVGTTGECAARPRLIPLEGHEVAAVAAGDDFSLALTRTGRVLQWGGHRGKCTTPTPRFVQLRESVTTRSDGLNNNRTADDDGFQVVYSSRRGRRNNAEASGGGSTVRVRGIAAAGNTAAAVTESGAVHVWRETDFVSPRATLKVGSGRRAVRVALTTRRLGVLTPAGTLLLYDLARVLETRAAPKTPEMQPLTTVHDVEAFAMSDRAVLCTVRRAPPFNPRLPVAPSSFLADVRWLLAGAAVADGLPRIALCTPTGALVYADFALLSRCTGLRTPCIDAVRDARRRRLPCAVVVVDGEGCRLLSSLRAFVRFLYTGTPDTTSPDERADVLAAAAHYGYEGSTPVPPLSESSPSPSFEADLTKHFGMLLETGLGSDITIDCGNGERTAAFALHRAVLCARSRYFRAMLGGAFVEAGADRVAIGGVDPRAMHLLFVYLYTDTVRAYEGTSIGVLVGLCAAAHMFVLPRLGQLATAAVAARLTDENVDGVLENADRLGLAHLCDVCVRYYATRAGHLLRGGLFDALAEEQQPLVEDALRASAARAAPLVRMLFGPPLTPPVFTPKPPPKGQPVSVSALVSALVPARAPRQKQMPKTSKRKPIVNESAKIMNLGTKQPKEKEEKKKEEEGSTKELFWGEAPKAPAATKAQTLDEEFPSLGATPTKKQEQSAKSRRWDVRPSQERVQKARQAAAAAKHPKPPSAPRNAWGVVPVPQKAVSMSQAAEEQRWGPARAYDHTNHQWNTAGVVAPDASFQEILDEEYARQLAAKYAAGIFDD